MKAIPPCFQCVCASARANDAHKLCAVRMRNANVRNDLKVVQFDLIVAILHHCQMTHDQSSAVFSFILTLTCKHKTKLDIVHRVKRWKQGQWRET